MITTVTQILLFIFLLLNLLVALYSTRRITTMDEYVKANKDLGGGALIATLSATLLGARNIGLKVGYELGLLSMLNPVLLALAAFILGTSIFPRMTQFTNEYTIAELMYTFFGSFARYFTFIVSSFFCFFVLVSQLVAWGNLSSIVGFSPHLMILIMGLFITFYTLLGGVRTVANTDILQLVVIVICSVFFFLIIFYQFGGIQNILNAIPKDKGYDALLTNPNMRGWLLSSFFYSFFPTLLICPPVVQRILMTDNRNNIKSMFSVFSIFYIIFRLLMLIVSFTRFSIPNSLTSVKALSVGDLVSMICTTPACQLLFLFMACSIIMSTMDSFLNSLSIMLVNDLIYPFTDLNNKREVGYIRVFSLLIGMVTIAVAILGQKLYFLTFFGYGAIALSSITMPFLFSLLGLKGSNKAFLVHILTFWLTILIPFLCVKVKISFFVKMVAGIAKFVNIGEVFTKGYTNMNICQALWYIAILTSTVGFLITHYIEYRGFLFVKRVRNIWVPQKKYTLKPFSTWITSPMQWANEKVGMVGEHGSLFAVIVICYYMLPYWANPEKTSLNYYGLYLLRISAVLLAFGTLGGKKMWKNSLQFFYNFYYQWAIFFCITFVNTLTSIADLNNHITPLYLAFSIIITSYLVDWNTFGLFQGLALFLSLLLHKIITGRLTSSIESEHVLPIVISLIFSIATGIIFINRSRNHALGLEAKVKSLEEEKQKILVSITESADQLSQAIKKDSMMMKEMQKNFKIVEMNLGKTDEVKAISSAMQYLYKKSEDAKRYLQMNVRDIEIRDLFDHAWHELTNRGLDPTEYNIHLDNQNYSTAIVGDFYYLKNLVVHATQYGFKNSKQNELKLIVDDVYIQYDQPIIYKNEPKKALRIVVTNNRKVSLRKKLYKPYERNRKGQQFPKDLKNNLRIIKAHFGFFSLAKFGEQVTQTYVLPLNLKSLRPKIKAFVYEDLFTEVRVDMPKDLEFLDKVAYKGMQNKKVKLAMQVAKHYHFLQKRKSGEPYYLHPLNVAHILLDYTDDEDIIVAGLLHDTIEDTPYEISQMQAMFGERVTRIVQEVTHLYNKEERPKMKLEKKETLDKLIENGNRDSLLIKLVDRLHNMRTIEGQPTYKKRKEIAEETKRIFIPIAQKLVIPSIEKELKERVASVMQKNIYLV